MPSRRVRIHIDTQTITSSPPHSSSHTSPSRVISPHPFRAPTPTGHSPPYHTSRGTSFNDHTHGSGSSFSQKRPSSGSTSGEDRLSHKHAFLTRPSSSESISSMSSLPSVYHHSAGRSPAGSVTTSPTALAIQRFIQGGGLHGHGNDRGPDPGHATRPLRIGSPRPASSHSSATSSPSGKGKALASHTSSSSASIGSPGWKPSVGAGTSASQSKPGG